MVERVTQGTFNARVYAIDRICRIWVPLIPALLWTALVAWVVGFPLSLVDFAGNLLGLQVTICGIFGGNIPLWSLAFEIWFYLLAGCGAAVLNSNRSVAGRWALLGLALAFAAFTRMNTLFLFCWLLGAFGYALRTIDRPGRFALLGGGVTLAGYLFSQLKSDTQSVDVTGLGRWIPARDMAILLFSLGLTLLFPWLIRFRPIPVFAAAVEKFGARLAAFSYTLYLTHYPVLALWDRFGSGRYATVEVGSLLYYGAKILSCLVFAWLFYLPFEARTSTIRSWLRGRLDPFPARASSPSSP